MLCEIWSVLHCFIGFCTHVCQKLLDLFFIESGSPQVRRPPKHSTFQEGFAIKCEWVLLLHSATRWGHYQLHLELTVFRDLAPDVVGYFRCRVSSVVHRCCWVNVRYVATSGARFWNYWVTGSKWPKIQLWNLFDFSEEYYRGTTSTQSYGTSNAGHFRRVTQYFK